MTGAKRVAEMLKNMKREKEEEKIRKAVENGAPPPPPTLADQEGLGIGKHGSTRNMVMQKLMRSQQTRVICLRNRVLTLHS